MAAIGNWQFIYDVVCNVTLQWEDVEVEVVEDCEGGDEVKLLLYSSGPVLDQAQARPNYTTTYI